MIQLKLNCRVCKNWEGIRETEVPGVYASETWFPSKEKAMELAEAQFHETVDKPAYLAGQVVAVKDTGTSKDGNQLWTYYVLARPDYHPPWRGAKTRGSSWTRCPDASELPIETEWR